jgi:diaminopimelate decarboxylase
VARRLAGLGAGAEVCSSGELHLARRAGFPAESTIFTGPGKTDDELAARVGITVVESIGEAIRLSRLTPPSSPRRVLVRVNPAMAALPADLPIASPVSKFGIDEDDVPDAYDRIGRLDGLVLAGLHMNTASGVLDPAALLSGHRHLLEIADRIEATGHPVPVVDLGGGIGVPYRHDEPAFDLAAYVAGLTALVERNPRRRYLLEIGRHLTAEHGWLVTAVRDVKWSGGRRVVVVDAGIHTLYRPLMAHANQLITAIDRDGRRRPAVVAGPLPSPEDVLTHTAELPDVDPGDLLVIPRCGAYAFAHSLQGFAGHAPPAEAVVADGEVHLARRRGDPDETLRNQIELADAMPGPVAIPGGVRR